MDKSNMFEAVCVCASIAGLFTSEPAAAAPPFDGFAPIHHIPVGAQPASLVAADFNGDGVLDIATANQGSLNVSILLGNGDGTFDESDPCGVFGPPNCIDVGDFNGDGALDLMTVSSLAGDMSLLLGHGDGTFAPVMTIPHGVGAHWVHVADFNLDDRADLAIGYAFLKSGKVNVFLGAGDGTFTKPDSYGEGAALCIQSADLSNDGVPDLVVIDETFNDLLVLIGNGDGTFMEPQISHPGVSPERVSINDFNDDGRPDCVVGRHGLGVNVLLGLGGGLFSDAVLYSTPHFPQSVATADMDGDGDVDIVSTSRTEGVISVLFNNSFGVFSQPLNVEVGPEPSAIVIDDFNDDGAPDVAVTNAGDASITILVNAPVKGPGDFQLLAPADGTAGLALPEVQWPSGGAVLEWSPAPGAFVRYTVRVMESDPPRTVVFEAMDLTEPQCAIPPGALRINTEYHWRVLAENSGGGATVPGFTFSTGTPADLNGDGMVNGTDLATLLTHWGVIR